MRDPSAGPSRPVHPALLLALVGLLAACCGPNRCPQAVSGRRVLDPLVGKIEEYKGRNGRYPVVLDDIEKGLEARMAAELKAGCPGCEDFRYGTDAFGYRLEYVYYRMGKHHCLYDTEAEGWHCRGVY